MKLLKLATAFCLLTISSELPAATPVNKFGKDTEVCDPVLIYTGGMSKRPVWDKRYLRSVLTHKYADGRRDWFYDSFIFNETMRECDRGNVVLGNATGGQLASVKEDWEWWLDHVFGKDHDIHMLDQMISDYKKEIGEPRMRHKVIIGACAPCKDGSGGGAEWADINWGEIDGQKIDFSKRADRIKAATWHIDQIKSRFESENFQNIDLAGIYWIEESLYSNQDIMAAINDHIHEIGLRSYWIPYWDNNDIYALEGREKYHFDMVWRQPNYFFYIKGSNRLPGKQQLISCIESSKKYGLGLELEFETSGKSNGMHETSPTMHQRLIDYIDAYEEYGVWEESGVAHYAGSKGFADMAGSLDAVNQATIDRLASIVAQRQSKFAGVTDVVADTQLPFVYTGPGEIYIPDNDANAKVYDLAGSLLFSGNGRFYCQSGIYIVTDGQGHACKVAVSSGI